MSRLIDSIPPPANPRRMKVIVLSLGRNGTLGLHRALNILGYRAYHFSVCFESIEHVRICTEAFEAKFFGKGKPFGRAEFDKWLGAYDAITDVPAFFVGDLITAYGNEPDVKFILTYRETNAWVRSIYKTFVPLQKAQDQFPLWPIRIVEPFTYRFFVLTEMITRVLWQDCGVYDGSVADAKLRQTYENHNMTVMALVPPEKLLVIKLENGLGWPEICPWLGKKTPQSTPYPRSNDPHEFKIIVNGFLRKHWISSLTKAGAIALPIAGLSTWYLTNRR